MVLALSVTGASPPLCLNSGLCHGFLFSHGHVPDDLRCYLTKGLLLHKL